MDLQSNNKPCLVKAREGFSVIYKDKYLYSKYDPQKNINQIINNLEILPSSLIFCTSPLLCYGIELLQQKLKENCLIIAYEEEKELHDITIKSYNNLKNKDNFCLLNKKQINEFLEVLDNSSLKFMNKGPFKRVIKIDFSAAYLLNQKVYEKYFINIQNIISQFWKNRLTLVQFGRRFSRNIFKNLVLLKESLPLTNLFNTITDDIIIIGTGESSEETIKKIKESNKKYFIICVDASLRILKENNINVDIVVSEECQVVIKKSFIGCKNYATSSVSGLTSCTNSVIKAANNNFWYIPVYCKTNFLKRIQNLNLVPFIPPLGSVGLTALYIALLLRKSEEINIFITGLDFSYFAGKTHANASQANSFLLFNCNKLKSIYNLHSSFINTVKINKKLISTQNLINYAELFTYIASNKKNIFDLRNNGINLGLTKKDFSEVKNKNDDLFYKKIKELNINYKQNKDNLNKTSLILKEFYTNEKKELEELKDILSNGQNINKEERDNKIKELIYSKEYLYLHFPDGIEFTNEISFLKRIRAEIDFFLKDINSALKILN